MHRLTLVLACLAVGVACSPKPDRYPPDVVQNFITSCTVRSSEKVCRCGIDKLQDRFTVDEFKGFETRLKQGEVPREMLDAISRCRD